MPTPPAPTASWYRALSARPRGQPVGRGRAPNPGRPTPRQETPPPPLGALVPPQQRAKPARKSARCGVRDGFPRSQPPHPRPVGNGHPPHAPRTGRRAWESAQSLTPHTQARGAPPPRAPSCRHYSAQSQLARACAVAFVTGLHTQTPRTHSQWEAGPGRTPQGQTVGRGRARNPGRPTLRQETPPPRAPSCRPHRPQSRLARAHTGRLVTGPHAHSPHAHSQWVVGPGRTPIRWAVGRGRAPSPGRCTPWQEPLPLGRPHDAPEVRRASSQERLQWS